MSTGFDNTEALIHSFRQGEMIILVDDEERENEGDLVIAAEHVTPEHINFMTKEGRGLVCLCLTEEKAKSLGLPPMVSRNTCPRGTQFTISMEAREGVTTGISAYDRAKTIQTAMLPDACHEDFVHPGHMFPIVAKKGGVLVRPGHTEAVVDFAKLAGLAPAGVLVEIMKEDGTMARRDDLKIFAKKHGLKMGTIADLIQHRLKTEGPFKSSEENMKSSLPNGKIVIACARFNPEVTQKLLKGAVDGLSGAGMSPRDVLIVECPGAVELPILMKNALLRDDVLGGIALGCVIQGETKHFDYVAGECSRGLMQVMLELNKPVAFGVLTTMNEEQAHARAGEGTSNKGHECAEVLLEMLQTIAGVRA